MGGTREEVVEVEPLMAAVEAALIVIGVIAIHICSTTVAPVMLLTPAAVHAIPTLVVADAQVIKPNVIKRNTI